MLEKIDLADDDEIRLGSGDDFIIEDNGTDTKINKIKSLFPKRKWYKSKYINIRYRCHIQIELM